jgi:uncharacterized iron-regulated membrane protein
MKSTTIRRLHRWLGLVFSVSILMSALSGVLHTVMTRTQTPPPPARPSGGGLDPAAIRVSVAEAIARLPAAGAVEAVNLRGIGGEPWYQIYAGSNGVPAYVSAADGRVDAAQDERHAAEIAAAFLGGAKVRKTAYLTEFDGEYINIFRVLPVHRFDAGDPLQTRVYVSTATGSVTRHTDRQRQFEANVFTNFHKLGFIPNRDVRDIVLAAMTGGIALAAGAGILLFFLTRPRKGTPEP